VLLLEEQELAGGDLHEALLRERHGEFVNIHANMQQIDEIYKDLALAVDSQQDHIDEMEMNVLNAQQSAEEGMQRLNLVAGMTLSQHVGERALRLGSGIFVTVAFLMLVYMLCYI
jgi:t-SNARE complex subunit (syntaxin)